MSFLIPKSGSHNNIGQFHQLRNTRGEIYHLEFSLDFIDKSDHDKELVFHNGLFCHFGQNEIITVINPAIFLGLLEKIRVELSVQPYQYLVSVHAYIELLLVELNRSKIAKGDEIWKPEALFLKFLEIVRINHVHSYENGIITCLVDNYLFPE